MRTVLCVCSLVVLCCAGVSAQDLKCEKYRLGNGMTVILHEDHSLPVACINTWFYVGSKDESPGRSGFAHLFEHLMFMGTRRVPENQFDVLMERGGGSNNASTSQDRTNYYSYGPSNLLSTLLWLDADRLEDLGNAMTQEKLDKQREVVRNERRQTSEMRPYGKADLKITELMFPPDHPYHRDVIGTHEDLEAATLRDVKDFFAAYYVPNNATLVVAGDFDPAHVKPLLERVFGTLPRGPEPARRKPGPVSLNEVRRVTYSDQVQFPRLTIAYHSPAMYSAGDAEMDLTADILADGKSSRLYERLVYKDRLATEVSAYQNSMMLGSLFQIEVMARQDVSLDRIEAATDEVLAEFLAKGPTKEELERRQASIEYAAIHGLQSVLAKADALNRYNFFLGEPNSVQRDLDRYRNATTTSVRNWAAKVLTPGARLIMRVLPEGENTASPRDTAPAALAVKGFSPPLPETFRLSNGIAVSHWRRSELPLVNVSLYINAGAAGDTINTAGLTRLATNMLDEGAGDLGALEYSEAMQQLGASLSSSVDQESSRVGLSVLKRNLRKALALYADAVLRPRFETKEWDRVKRLHLEALKQVEDRPEEVARRVGLRTFFGDDHAYGRPVDGTIASVEAITLDAARNRQRALCVPSRATFFIAGDLTAAEAKEELEREFGAWKETPQRETHTEAAKQVPPANQALRVVLVDKPQAVQTVIRFYMPGEPFRSPDRIKLECLNTILGGSFTSRLNQNLREKNGYTYGARSVFTMKPAVGYFAAGADVQAEHTGDALKEFLAEFAKLRGGDVSPEETEKTRRTNRTEEIQKLEGLGGLLDSAQLLHQNGLPFSALAQDLTAIEAVSQEDLNRLARPAIALEKAVLVLVGNTKLINDQLKGLPLPPPGEVTVTGDPKAASPGGGKN